MTGLKKKHALFFVIIIGLFLVVLLCNRCGVLEPLLEPFQGWAGRTEKPLAVEPGVGEAELKVLRERLEAAFNIVSTSLCPSFNLVKEEMAKGAQGLQSSTKAEKEAAAIKQMTEEAGGRIYDCRSYPDHLQVPADIGNIVSNSAAYLYTKLMTLTENVKAALSCKPMEGYADVCSAELMSVRKKLETEKAAASCMDPASVDNLTKKMMLETRIKSIEGAVNDPAWEPVVGKIRVALKFFMEIKAKIDAGTLMPDCGDGMVIPGRTF